MWDNPPDRSAYYARGAVWANKYSGTYPVALVQQKPDNDLQIYNMDRIPIFYIPELSHF